MNMYFIEVINFDFGWSKFNFTAKNQGDAVKQFEAKYPELAEFNDYEYEVSK